MSEERKKILEMLAEGKITIDEAEKLLSALSSSETAPRDESTKKTTAKYLHVLVEPDPRNQEGEKVNVRVPLNLIRAGLKWAALIPKHAQSSVNQALHEKGIELDLGAITAKDIEELLTELNDLTVDIEGKEKVRVYCE